MDDKYFNYDVGIPLDLACDLDNPNIEPCYDPTIEYLPITEETVAALKELLQENKQ